MGNSLRYWDSKLHLSKIRELMKVVLVNEDINGKKVDLRDINIVDKSYNVSIKDDLLNIKCSDGRELYISLYSKSFKHLKVEPRITYLYGKERLTMIGDEFKTGSINFDDSFNRHFIDFDDFYNDEQLIKNCEFYTNNGTRNVSFNFNGINNFIYTLIYSEFGSKYYFNTNNDDYIIFSDGVRNECRVSLDGKKIISYNGVNLPSLEEIKSFNFEEQIQKVKDLLEKNIEGISSFTLDYLRENIYKLEEKQEIKDKYMKLYKYQLPICREALQIRAEFLKKLDNYTFSEDELKMIISLLKEEIIARINKDNEKTVVKKKSLNC